MVMANDLTKISGIGAAAAASLSKAGFTTVEMVANATPEALGKVNGFGADRAARVIADAKKLTGQNKASTASAPKAPLKSKPAATTSGTAATTKKGNMRKSLAFASLAVAAVVVLGYIIVNPSILNGPHFAPDVNAQTMAPQTTVQANVQSRPVSAQRSMVPEWVSKQRAEAEKYIAESRKRFDERRKAMPTPREEPEWVKKQRAEAEKYRAESQKRYEELRKAGFKPQPEPEWVAKQRAEAQKRFAGQAPRGYGVPYGAPPRPAYGAPYGYYAPQAPR